MRLFPSLPPDYSYGACLALFFIARRLLVQGLPFLGRVIDRYSTLHAQLSRRQIKSDVGTRTRVARIQQSAQTVASVVRALQSPLWVQSAHDFNCLSPKRDWSPERVFNRKEHNPGFKFLRHLSCQFPLKVMEIAELYTWKAGYTLPSRQGRRAPQYPPVRGSSDRRDCSL